MTTDSPNPAAYLDHLRAELPPRAEPLRVLAGSLVGAPDALARDAERVAVAAAEFHRAALEIPQLDDPAHARRIRHDLLNMLNRVLGYAQLLLESDDLPAAWPDALRRVLELARECERAVQARPTSQADSAPAPAAHVCTPMLPGNVLVVEDDPDSREALARALRALGHVVEEAADGHQAVALVSKHPFDLVLLDIRMPGMDGYQVLQAIRADPRRHLLPVMMISGLDEVAHTVRCIEAGAEDFLSKPIDHVLLRARVNSMLHRRHLRIRELEQFFPGEVARLLIDRPELLEEGHEADISVLFCDIRGYSRVARRLGPAATIEWVSAVMEELTTCVLDGGGVVVDFAGDELFAMWGAPASQPDHAARACATGLRMLGLLPALNDAWRGRIGEDVAFGVGVHSGPAWVGNSGTRRKFKYGPSGDTVNLGSRVQGATKYLKAPMLISAATREWVGEAFAARRLGRVRVVNIAEPVDLYEVVPEGGPAWDEQRRDHEEALALYEARRLDEAARLLGARVARQGASGPPLALLARTIQGILEPERWQPVFELPGK